MTMRNFKTGGFTQAATAIAVDIAVGFVPRKVVMENETDRILMEWDDTMADGECTTTLADGTRKLIAASGITPIDGDNDTAQGFTFGLDTLGEVNIADKVYKWTAWK